MRFTVFTPAYNRGYIIEQLYESLCRQTFRDFEWIVVDDGSTDNTEEVMTKLMAKEPFFPIIYRKQPNGGKHRAWNRGIDLASGELFFGCDSDDYLTDDALEVIDQIEKSIPTDQKQCFAGVCGLRGYNNSDINGTSFSDGEYLDLTYLERLGHNVSGDKAEVIYTSVWKRFKYHEFEEENFLTEATALFRMDAAGLKMRYFNTIVKVGEYLPDGLTANSRERFIKNPKGWGLYIAQRIQYGLLSGTGKWDVLTDYFMECRLRMRIWQMADALEMNACVLMAGVMMTVLRYRRER